MFHAPKKYRISGTASDGNNGDFMISGIRVRASDGMEWEHVSVSLEHRVPRWNEMCNIKDLFWDDEDVVVQYHPAKSLYVNNNPFVLHLWRPIGVAMPMPPLIMV